MPDNPTLIGRKAEQSLLNEYLISNRSEFIALYGRRRVGKTFLVRETLGSEFAFYVTGLQNGTYKEQIDNFNTEIHNYGGNNLQPAKNWREAFYNLHILIDASKKKGKKVIFFDEIPWMCTPKSDFLSALDHFWNRYASMRKDVFLIICGSASSWIIENITNT